MYALITLMFGYRFDASYSRLVYRPMGHWGRMGTDYLDVYSVWILPFPRTVYHSDLHEITCVRIEMSPGYAISRDTHPTFGKSHMTKSMSKR